MSMASKVLSPPITLLNPCGEHCSLSAFRSSYHFQVDLLSLEKLLWKQTLFLAMVTGKIALVQVLLYSKGQDSPWSMTVMHKVCCVEIPDNIDPHALQQLIFWGVFSVPHHCHTQQVVLFLHQASSPRLTGRNLYIIMEPWRVRLVLTNISLWWPGPFQDQWVTHL